jgi:CHAT domain-containing protein
MAPVSRLCRTVPFTACHSRVESARLPATRALVVTPPARLVDGLPPLTHAVEEGRAIARSYNGAMTLDGSAATAEAVMAAIGGYEIVHFAGHAVANPDYPSLSRLLLAPSTSDGMTAMLTSDQISQLDLSNTTLVVLAACSTASGRISRGQGALGLARPFLQAGAGSVVATLWDVSDRPARVLFTAFHDRFRETGDVAVSLQAAQMQLLKSSDPALRHPAAWAGVVHQARVAST